MSFLNRAKEIGSAAWNNVAKPSGSILGELAQGAFTRPKTALTMAVPGAFAIGAGSSLLDQIDNTDVRDKSTFDTLYRAKESKDHALWGTGLGATQGAVMGAFAKPKSWMKGGRGALAGAALGGLGGGLSNLVGGDVLSGIGGLGAGIGVAALSRGSGMSALKSSAMAAPSLLYGTASMSRAMNSEINPMGRGRDQLSFAMDLKNRDRTQDMQGPEMAQSMVGQVDGPMTFGKSTPRSYSLGATGDLSLSLHKLRHGGR